jgi:hypothetical protein
VHHPDFLQDAGLARFPPVEPQRCVVASFEYNHPGQAVADTGHGGLGRRTRGLDGHEVFK